MIKQKTRLLARFFLPFQWEDNTNVIGMVTMAITIFWSVTLDFLFCDFGQRVTNRYAVFGDQLCKCHWYLLPIEMQRIYSGFLLNTQQELFIQSYGDIVCSRNTFKMVITFFLQSLPFLWIQHFFFRSTFSDDRFAFCFSFLDNEKRIFIFYDTSSNEIDARTYNSFVTKSWRRS